LEIDLVAIVDLVGKSDEMRERRHVCWFWLPRVLLL